MSRHKSKKYPRFDKWQRLEHGLLLASFTILAISGLPQRYPDTMLGNAMIQLMGGIELTRHIHRAAAIILMLETIYHGGVVTYKIWVKRVNPTMLASWQDVKDGFQALAYNLGLTKMHPKMGRYTFAEKFEYWAVVWGTVVMIITGFMLWNPIATTKFLPGQFIPAAKAAHSGEALLAVLAIITWHVYNVHIKYFNRSIFTGKISQREMVEEHPLELTQFETQTTTTPTATKAGIQRRRRVFYPVAVVIAGTLLTGLYFFITYEETAITTVPPQDIEVFVTATPDTN